MNQISEVEINYIPRPSIEVIKITCSSDAQKLFQSIWSTKMGYLEQMYVLLLNRANFVLGFHCLSSGGTCGTVLDIKVLFQLLLKCNAHSFVLAHNHPSGNTKPSREDLKLTQRIKTAGSYFDIPLLDHLILSPHGHYYSLADEGDL